MSMRFSDEFSRYEDNKDGPGLYRLLLRVSSGSVRPALRARMDRGGKQPLPDRFFGALARGASREGLAELLAVVAAWCERYRETSPRQRKWLVHPLLHFLATTRMVAAELDQREKSGEHKTRVVEVFRVEYQKLHRDKDLRAGALSFCAELLRLYFALNQAEQGQFLLNAALAQPVEWDDLPKALGVPLSFMQGKLLLLDGKVALAEARLDWAFRNCHPEAWKNRRQILVLLVPCRLRLGRCPRPRLLKEFKLDFYSSICAAIREGNVSKYQKALEQNRWTFARCSVLGLMEKTKLLALQNLLARVFAANKQLLRSGLNPADAIYKQELQSYQRALSWQLGPQSLVQTMALLSTLIRAGAVKGYLSDEHRKIVFGKAAQFPPASEWSLRL